MLSRNGIYEIRESHIQGAGQGAFAAQRISAGQRIGEYVGKELSEKQWLSLPNKDYVYRVDAYGSHDVHYIDGKQNGNWLSYINGAKTNDERKDINIECYQHAKRIFFKAINDIEIGTEFIIDYGDSYWEVSDDNNIPKKNKDTRQHMQCEHTNHTLSNESIKENSKEKSKKKSKEKSKKKSKKKRKKKSNKKSTTKSTKKTKNKTKNKCKEKSKEKSNETNREKKKEKSKEKSKEKNKAKDTKSDTVEEFINTVYEEYKALLERKIEDDINNIVN